MILGPHRQPLYLGIGGRALGNRPAFKHTVHLETQVPVKSGRIVLLDDEEITSFAALRLTRGFGRFREVAFRIVIR